MLLLLLVVLMLGDGLMSPADLAQFLGVPLGTVYRWNYTGDGPRRLRIGRYCKYRRQDVESWLDSRQAPSKPAA